MLLHGQWQWLTQQPGGPMGHLADVMQRPGGSAPK
jgi:hypothetical protein